MEQPPNPEVAEHHHSHASDERWSGLQKRIITGSIIAIVFLAMLLRGGALFDALVLMAGLQMIREWDALTHHEGVRWKTAGLFYAMIPCLSFIWLRNVSFEGSPEAGMRILLYLVLVVIATDVGAYFTGKRFGKHPLAPVISPKKTWEGLGGGMLAATIIGGFSASFTPYPVSILPCALWGFLLAGVAQTGDLFESWLKRRAGVKDSSGLIPGHGGLLDRVDGFTFTAPLLALMTALSGQVI